MNARHMFAGCLLAVFAAGCSSEPSTTQRSPVRGTPNTPNDEPTEEPSEEEPCQPVAELTLEGQLPIKVSGTFAGMKNDYAVGPERCRESETNTLEDVAYTFTAPMDGNYRFTSWAKETEDSFPSGIVMTIAEPLCGAPEITCQAYDVPPGVDVTLKSGQTVLVILDPAPTQWKEYTLTVEKK